MYKKDISELVSRYEESRTSNKKVYFDAFEFEELAEYYDMQNDAEQVLKIIEDGLKIHPHSSSLIIRKIKYLVYNNEFTEAFNLINVAALEYDYDLNLLKVECFLNLGLEDEAKDAAREMIEIEEESLGELFEELGYIYFEAALYAEALLFFEKSLEYSPDNVEVLNNEAFIYENEGDLDMAIAIHNKILDVDSYAFDSWVNIARLYSVQDEFTKAIDALDFALTINENNLSVLKMKGHCLSLSNQLDEAISIYKYLLEFDPDDASAYFLLADCYLRYDMYKDALECLDKYEADFGKDEDSISKRASVFMQQGDLDKALSIVLHAANRCSGMSELNFIAGEVYFKQKDYKKAKSFFEKSFNENEDNIVVAERLFTLNLIKKDYIMSLYYIEKLSDMEPYNRNVINKKAILYWGLGYDDKFNELIDMFDRDDLLDLYRFVFSDDCDDFISKDEMVEKLNAVRSKGFLFDKLK